MTDRFFYGLLSLVAVTFLAVGIALVVGSSSVVEQSFDYTDCVDPGSGQSCAWRLQDPSLGLTNTSATGVARCTCTVIADLKGFGNSKPSLFYAMENFNQNHRFLVKSRWEPQLRSSTIAGGADCSPLLSSGGLFYAPCGMVANSMFNDTIRLYQYTGSSLGTQISLSGKRISWASDRTSKFKNPTKGPLCSFPDWSDSKILRPPNWPVRICEVGANTTGIYNPWSPAYASNGLGYENEDFIVWMRMASSPNFRKLYRFVLDPLPDGQYAFVVEYNFPVTAFGGKKFIVLSTQSWLGGQNPFLGALYLVVACLLIVIMIVFVLLGRSRKPAEPKW